MIQEPSFKSIPVDKKAIIRDVFLNLDKEREERMNGLPLDFEALYLVAYK